MRSLFDPPQSRILLNPDTIQHQTGGRMLPLPRGAAVAAAAVARRRAGGISSSLLWRPPPVAVAAAAAAAQCQRRQRRGLASSSALAGLMMHEPLLISSLIQHADRHHPDAEIVSRRPEDGAIHRYTYRWVVSVSYSVGRCAVQGASFLWIQMCIYV